MKLKILLLLIVLSSFGCTLAQDDNTPVPTHTAAPSPSPTPPSLDRTRRAALEVQYELLRQTQEQIVGVWQDLQAGQSVACTPSIEMPFSPSAITGEDEISLLLFQAALAVQDAVSLWDVECQNPRSQPPADVIERGVLAALAGGDVLFLVQGLLATTE